MKPCKEPGCAKAARARGMCHYHYCAWYRNYKHIAGNVDYVAMALEMMPGTYEQLAERMGVVYQTAFKIVRRLHVNGQAHIGDNQAPDGSPSSRWVAIFHAGEGVDKIVTTEEKRAFWKANTYPRKLAASAKHKRIKRRRAAPVRPVNFAGLLAPLMNIPTIGA
jgi:hypothetical protein